MVTNSSRKLKFLFVTADKYPPFRVDITKLFAQELVGKGHIIDWLLQAEERCTRAYHTTWAESKVWVGKTDDGTTRLARLRKHLFGISHDLRMFKLLRSQQYDFVQVKDKYIAALFAIIAVKLAKTRFIYWSSYPFPEASLYEAKVGTARYPIFWFIRGIVLEIILYRVVTKFADHIFVQSEQMKKDFIKKGVAAYKLTAVPMGFSPGDFAATELKRTPNVPTVGKSVVYLGTLIKARNLDFVVRAFAKVLEKIPDVTLFFVGGGEDPQDEKFLQQESKRLDIDHATVFTGFLPRQEAMMYVKNSSVCVSPFYPTPILHSTSPTKLIEYMALGKAVVANDHPEQRLVLEDSQGGICVPWEEEAFAAAIIEMLQNPETAKKMGESGRRYVNQHRTYSHIADQVEAEYLRVCS